MDALRDTVGSCQTRLTAAENIAEENFEHPTAAEATIKSLQELVLYSRPHKSKPEYAEKEPRPR